MTLAQTLHEQYLQRFPAQAARVIEQAPDLLPQLDHLSGQSLLMLFEHVDPAHLKPLFLLLNLQQQRDVLQGASIRTALHILGSLSEEERAAMLAGLQRTLADELSRLMNFPEGTAGWFMDRVANHYRPDQSVSEALALLRKSQSRSLRSLHLTDQSGKLMGRVDVQGMALAEPEALMSELLQPVGAVAYLTSTEKDLVDQFDQFRVDSIPVIDQENKLLGVVRYANLFEAAEKAATSSMQRMVGASAEERALSTPLFAVKRRLFWLHINLVTAFLAAAVVGLFESTIAQFTALAILLPVVAGQSGNAGSQALAVTMRGLTLKEITGMHWKAVLRKEVQIGLINGSALALTCGAGVFLWSQSLGLAIVIAIAMVTAMIMAGISGALVPIILMRVGQDPATASSIILTTVTDVSGFLAFLGTATLLSSIL